MQTPMTTQLRRYYQSGFTLIELLIVIAIIGILAAVGIPQYGNYLDRSAVSACQAELSSYRNAIIAESSTSTESNATVIGAVDFAFQSCTVSDEGALATAFINSGNYSDIETTRDGAASLSIENGRIVVDQAGDPDGGNNDV